MDGTVAEMEVRTSLVQLGDGSYLAQTVLRDLSDVVEHERRRTHAERQYATLVQHGTVGVIEASYTDLFDEYERLRQAGVTDLEAILDPVLQQELGARVQYLGANAALHAIFGARSLRELAATAQSSVTPELLTTFRGILLQWWAGDPLVRVEFPVVRLDGAARVVQMEVQLPMTREDAARVAVSFIDVTDLREAEHTVARTEREIHELVDAAPLAIGRLLPDGTITYANASAISMLGLDASSDATITLFDITHELDRQMLGRQLNECVALGRRVGPFEKRCKPADGRAMWSRVLLTPLLDDDEVCRSVLVLAEDITEARRDREALAVAAAAVHGADEGVVVFDENLRVRSMNPAAERISGHAADHVRVHSDLGRYADTAKVGQALAALASTGYWRGEIEMKRPDKSPFIAAASARFVESDQSGDRLILVVFSDVTDVRRAEERVAFLETYDELTGLPNRASLTRLVEEPPASGLLRAVVMIDLDRFAEINDSLGHEVGDRLLIDVARRLSAALPSDVTLTRHGGDEFVVVADVATPDVLEHLTESVRSAFSEAYTVAGRRLFVRASIGVALGSEGASQAEVLRDAESAMFHAKASYSDVAWFTDELAETLRRRRTMESALHTALDAGQLEVHYQPQVALVDDALVGAEALVRWRHPQRGLVSPAEFIPMAERTGLIERIGRTVLDAACRQAAAWRTQGLLAGRIAVNLSARQLASDDIVADVVHALESSGLPPHALELEVTESVLMENVEQALVRLDALRDLGVRLAIDDFGTGYSSLAYLARLPISRLKIDRSFVAEIGPQTRQAPIIDSILALATSLGLKVIAEGVETEAQHDYLYRHGCLRAQGYLYGRPMPAREFVQWIEERERAIRSTATMPS